MFNPSNLSNFWSSVILLFGLVLLNIWYPEADYFINTISNSRQRFMNLKIIRNWKIQIERFFDELFSTQFTITFQQTGLVLNLLQIVKISIMSCDRGFLILFQLQNFTQCSEYWESRLYQILFKNFFKWFALVLYTTKARFLYLKASISLKLLYIWFNLRN